MISIDETVFGPAGFPVEGPSGPEAMQYLRSRGLLAMEYQAVRSVAIKAKAAKELGEAAKEAGIVLTLHAPYAINFCSKERAKMAGSKRRLVQAALAAHRMGAFHVTFHSGYYGGMSLQEAYEMQIRSISEVRKKIDDMGVKVELGPETTGKESQFGSLDEVLSISREVHGVRPTIDFAHIHVRRKDSRIKGEDDYRRILEAIEKALGTDGMDALVIHFSEVEPTQSGAGERRHHPLGSGYGPKFRPLAKIISENDYRFVLISESPLLELDSIKMKGILGQEIKRIKSE